MGHQSEFDGIEIRTLMEAVPKYYFHVTPNELDKTIDYMENLTGLNREIRDWLGQNCGCTWETKLEGKGQSTLGISIYFDLDSDHCDLMAFKLRWL